MREPPSTIRMGPQRAVVGLVALPNLVVAPVKLYMLSYPSVSHTNVTWSCPWRPHPQPSLCSCFSIPYFFLKFSLFLVHFFSLFSSWIFHSGWMAKFLLGQSELWKSWDGRLSDGGMIVTFLRPPAPKISAMHCAALNKIDSSYIVCERLFSTLSHIDLPRHGLLVSAGTEFLERAKFS